MIKKLTNHTKKISGKFSSLYKKNPRFAPFALLAVIFLVLLAVILFQNNKLSQFTSLRGAKKQSTQNAMTAAFVKSGVTSCKDRIEQVTNFLSANTKSAATIFFSNKDQNDNIASISMEITGKGGDFAYSSASFSPNDDNCSAVYEAVKYWDISCSDVAQKLGVNKDVPKMLQNIKILNINNNTKIFLMPAKEGCVSVKKEVIFN